MSLGSSIRGYGYLTLLLFVYASLFVILPFLSIAAVFGIAFVLAALLLVAVVHRDLVVTVFWFTLVLSAIQNVVLGALITDITDHELRMILVMNYLVYAGLFVLIIMSVFGRGLASFPTVYLIAISAICVVSFVLMPDVFEAVIASVRNISAPYLYCVIGWMMVEHGGKFKIDSLKLGVIVFVLFLFAFGIVERFIIPDLWQALNITKLWLGKGLHVQGNGYPGNFYASERFGGDYIRRLVSSYADPINLGTNLYLFFCLGWYFRKYYLVALCSVMILLAVSKGSALGVMIFLLFYLRQRYGRLMYLFGGVFLALVGASFLYWAYVHDAHSVIVHILGFTNSLHTLVTHPLGYGLGNVGVLAGLFGEQADSSITESGLGLIIGQLGVAGLVCFVMFVAKLGKAVFGRGTDPMLRENVLMRSLLVGIVANIAFDEVALSPNSCAGYFLLFGILACEHHRGRLRL